MNLETIPIDLKIQILKYLSVSDLVNVWKSSKNLYNLSTYEIFWRYVNEHIVGQSINIDSWMKYLKIESHHEFYKKVIKYASLLDGIHCGDIYPRGLIHRWVLDVNTPQAVGYLVDPKNDFRASERYLQSFLHTDQGYMYSDVGCNLYNNIDIEVSAGVILNENERKKYDLLVIFTPSDQLLPVKAFDIEMGESNPISILFDKLDVKTITESEDDKFSHPSKHLVTFVDNNENGYIYIVNFGKVYQCWPVNKSLCSVKLKYFNDKKDNLEGIYAAQQTGRGLKLYGGKITNENGYVSDIRNKCNLTFYWIIIKVTGYTIY